MPTRSPAVLLCTATLRPLSSATVHCGIVPPLTDRAAAAPAAAPPSAPTVVATVLPVPWPTWLPRRPPTTAPASAPPAWFMVLAGTGNLGHGGDGAGLAVHDLKRLGPAAAAARRLAGGERGHCARGHEDAEAACEGKRDHGRHRMLLAVRLLIPSPPVHSIDGSVPEVLAATWAHLAEAF